MTTNYKALNSYENLTIFDTTATALALVHTKTYVIGSVFLSVCILRVKWKFNVNFLIDIFIQKHSSHVDMSYMRSKCKCNNDRKQVDDKTDQKSINLHTVCPIHLLLPSCHDSGFKLDKVSLSIPLDFKNNMAVKGVFSLDFILDRGPISLLLECTSLLLNILFP